MINKYIVRKIVYAYNIKQVLDLEKGEVTDVCLEGEVNSGDKLGFSKEDGTRQGDKVV